MLALVSLALLAAQDFTARAECVTDGSTVSLNNCAYEDVQLERARMEHYLAVALEAARSGDAASAEYGGDVTQQAAYLAAAQAAWTAYAEITCDGVYDQWRNGSIRNLMHHGCMSRMIRERTHAIWRDHLTFMDSTPPVLPEPTEPAAADLPAPVRPDL